MKHESKGRRNGFEGASTKQGPVRRQVPLQLFNKVFQEKQLLILLENCCDKQRNIKIL